MASSRPRQPADPFFARKSVVRPEERPASPHSVRICALDRVVACAGSHAFLFPLGGAVFALVAVVAHGSVTLELGNAKFTTRRPRLLIREPGLDGHDRGAKYVAQILRDAGFEVIYTGIRCSPEQIVEAAIQEDVSGIDLSLLSGAHLVQFGRVMELLHERGADDIVVFGGGTIPPADAVKLKTMGVAAVFTPGASAREIVETVEELLAANAAAQQFA